MGMTNDVSRVELQTNADEFARQIARSEQALQGLQQQLQVGAIGFADFERETDQQTVRLEQLRKQAASTADALNRLGPASVAAEGATKNYGRSLMQISFVAQDFMSAQGDIVRGLYAVQNNIPGVLTSLGVGQGLAGTVAIASLAVGSFAPVLVNAAKEMHLFGEAAKVAKDSIERLQARIQELEKKPTKLAVDMRELDEAKQRIRELQKDRDAFEAAGEGKTVFEKKAGDAFRKQFTESGEAATAARDAIAQRMRQEFTAPGVNAKLDEALEAQRKAEAEIAQLQKANESELEVETVQANISRIATLSSELDEKREAAKQLKQKAYDDADIKTGGLFRVAFAGSNDPNARTELARRFRQAGQEPFARMAEFNTPEAFEEEDRAQEEERIHQGQQQQLQRRNEEAKALEDQGRANQEADRDRMASEAKSDVSGLTGAWKDVIIRARAAGANAEQEIDRLKPQITDAVKKVGPELERRFPNAIKEVVDQLVLQAREAADKAIAQLEVTEGLTKQQALQRLGQQQAQKDQGDQEKLALDEFTKLAGIIYRRDARMNPNLPELTPEMQAGQGHDLMKQMKEAGLSPQQLLDLSRGLMGTVGNPRGGAVMGEAFDALRGAGFDDAAALRQIPNVFGHLRHGAGGVPQAIERILQGQMRQRRNAAEAEARQQGRTARAPKGRGRKGGTNTGARNPQQFAAGANPAVPRITPGEQRAAEGRLEAGLGGGGGFRSVAPTAPGAASVGAGMQPIAQALEQFAAGAGQSGQQTLDANGRILQLLQGALQNQQTNMNATGQLLNQLANLQQVVNRHSDWLNQLTRGANDAATRLNIRGH